jgi:uncharacterized protein
MKISRVSKYYYLRFLRLKGTPKELALGSAIGVLIGISPTMPFHTILILLTTLVTRSSFLAAMIASFAVCNPLTYIPIYYFSMVFGNIVTPYELNWEKIRYALDIILTSDDIKQSIGVLADLGFEAVVVMVIGGFVFALPFTIASYYLSFQFFIQLRKKRREKQKLN